MSEYRPRLVQLNRRNRILYALGREMLLERTPTSACKLDVWSPSLAEKRLEHATQTELGRRRRSGSCAGVVELQRIPSMASLSRAPICSFAMPYRRPSISSAQHRTACSAPLSTRFASSPPLVAPRCTKYACSPPASPTTRARRQSRSPCRAPRQTTARRVKRKPRARRPRTYRVPPSGSPNPCSHLRGAHRSFHTPQSCRTFCRRSSRARRTWPRCCAWPA